jgi:hypothetical protein
MINRLVFDTTDAATIADSSNVGAYIRAADGTLITHTGGALDVNVANAITVDVDLDFATDSVDVSGSTVELGATTLAALEDITVSGTVELGATTLAALEDINATVSGTVELGATTLAALEDINATVSGTVELGATTLAALEDINATVNDAALANTAIASASNNLSTANTAEDVVASPLSGRKYLMIYNNGNKMSYIGASGVSASNGYPIPAGSEIALRAGSAIDIEWVSSDTSQQIRTLELA